MRAGRPQAFVWLVLSASLGLAAAPAAVGDPLPRVVCADGAEATVYAEGLVSPDGLALGPDGLLYVAEEAAGRVTRVAQDGGLAVVLGDLANPEGVAFAPDGSLYVAEDVKGGRVVRLDSGGLTQTLAFGLDSPEGIVWDPAGVLYVTESNLEYALSISSTNAADYRTHVTAISMTGEVTRLLTTTAIITASLSGVEATFWSYAGLSLGPDGRLYFTNELSGQEMTGTVDYFGQPVPYHANSSGGLFSVEPGALPAEAEHFAGGVIAPEGLRFSSQAGFPLYVAEEDIGGGAGRLSRIDAGGQPEVYCTGFESIEDVIVDADGRLYVSEDSTGWIIQITPPRRVWLPLVWRQP